MTEAMIALLTRGTRQKTNATNKVASNVAIVQQPPVLDKAEKPSPSAGEKHKIAEVASTEVSRVVRPRKELTTKEPMLSANDDDSSDDDVCLITFLTVCRMAVLERILS